MKRILTLLVTVSLLTPWTFASTKEAMEHLTLELQNALKDLPDGNVAANERFAIANALRELSAIPENQWELLGQTDMVRQLSVSAPNDKIREAAAALIEEAGHTRTIRETAKVKRMTTVMTDALKAALAAEKADGIDEPLAKVSQILVDEGEESRSPPIQKLLQQSHSLAEFLRHLQDLLAGFINSANAAEELRQVQQPQFDFSNLVPRSQILARIKAIVPALPAPKPFVQPSFEASAEEVESIIAGVKSLDDLETAEAAIGKLPASVRQTTFGPLGQLETIIRTYEQIKNGSTSTATLAVLTNQTIGGAAGSNAQLARLSALVVNYGLPRALQLPPTMRPEVAENRPAYFDRVMKFANEQKDWALLARLIDASQKIGSPVISNANDTNGYTSFLGGLNHEKARQYTFAVISYLAALSSGSRVVPVDYLGERLDQIKKEHPQEYERGASMALPSPKVPELGSASDRPEHNPNARDRTPILAPPQSVNANPAH